MATKPTNLARWAETAGGTPAANITEPASGLKDTGFAIGAVPSSANQNWWQAQVYQWIKYLDDLVNQALTWTKTVTVRSTSGNGVDAQTTANAGAAVNAFHTGTGKGVYAGNSNTASNAPGILGETNGGTGAGVEGNTNVSTAPAVRGVGSNLGPAQVGVEAKGFTGVSAPLSVVAQAAAPASPREGDVYYNSGTHKLYCWDGTIWQALF